MSTRCVVAFAGLVTVLATDADVDRAMAAVQVHATAGDVIAQFSLGSALYYGAGDTAAAIVWLRRAATQKHAPAEHQLGQLFDFGFGIARDTAEALSWYRRAADHGSAPAQRTLGECYLKGRGVTASPIEAERWLRRAAQADDIRAQYLLGDLYLSGAGVPHDYQSAYVWLDLAASQAPLTDNRLGLVELRDIAAARMTPAQIKQARLRVLQWKPAVWRTAQ